MASPRFPRIGRHRRPMERRSHPAGSPQPCNFSMLPPLRGFFWALRKLAAKSLTVRRDPIERSFLRLLLAARALQTYDDLSLTDALLDLEAPDLEAKLERLLLSTALRSSRRH